MKLVHILVLGCLITSSLHPEMMRGDMEPGSSMNTDGILVLEKSNGNTDGGNAVLEIQYETPSATLKKFKREDLCIAFALVMCSVIITLMMVYGAVRSRPGYLMPFFCLQVFDFCITSLSVVGYMTYAPNIKLWLIQQKIADYPGMDRLMMMDEQWLMLLLFIIFILVLSVKAYLANMVWSTYKYLQLRNASRSVVREYRVDPDTEMLLPPKYEEAMKMKPVDGPAPPPYSAL